VCSSKSRNGIGIKSLTVVGFHLNTAGSGEDAAAISTPSFAVVLVEFAGVVKDVLAFRL